MSKNAPKRNATHSRVDRFTQMSKQEEIIAEKKRLIEAKLKMMETEGKSSNQSTSNKNELTTKPTVQNTFSNDGSFLEKFKKISGGSNPKTDEIKSDRRQTSKPNKSYSYDNNSRSNNTSRWNNYTKKDDQRSSQHYGQDSYNKSLQNNQHNSYDTNYSSSNHNYQRSNYPTPSAPGNTNMSMNNMRGHNYPNNPSFPDDPYMRNNNMLNSPPQYGNYPNNNNTNNWNNGPNATNPMSHYNPGSGSRPMSSNPTAHIPALTSLIIPPPTNLQIPTATNVQIPPPLIQPNLSVPPPSSISLQSIPEPKPLETTSIPRPGPLNLLTIPPPLPLCLNQIPKPKDIDVRNIPPPKQYNLSGIEMPSSAYSERNDYYRKSNTVLSTDNQMSRTQGSNHHSDLNQSKPECIPIERVAKLVVEIGDGYEEIFKQKHQHEPEFWFLFHQDSAEYMEYKKLVKKLKEEKNNQDAYSPEELYEPEFSLNDEDDDDIDEKQDKQSSTQKSLVSSFYDDPNDHNVNSDSSSKHERTHSEEEENRRKRKRKSRWGNDQESKPVIGAPGLVQVPNLGAPSIALPAHVAPLTIPVPHIQINKVTRTDSALLQYAKNTFGTTNLSEEDWAKAEDHFKINLLYQEMLRKRKELDQLSRSGKHKYAYDSDEEVEGGTWEHKLRSQEMEATQKWADELTKKSEGKHHIGDFLPPEELKKFMEKYSAAKNGREPDISDYKEYKLNEKNVGFQMLQKLGWKDGEGLGSTGSGIVEPINKASNRESNQGLGLDRPDNIQTEDNEYDAYRKRMMLAYRFRPNPLNNPRRPYY